MGVDCTYHDMRAEIRDAIEYDPETDVFVDGVATFTVTATGEKDRLVDAGTLGWFEKITWDFGHDGPYTCIACGRTFFWWHEAEDHFGEDGEDDDDDGGLPEAQGWGWIGPAPGVA